MLDSISIFRVIKSGAINFFRNRWLSATATMVMTITLVIFSILFLLFAVTDYSLKSIRDKIDISVYFKNGLSEDKIVSIKNDLEKNQKIKTVNYTSAAQALLDFKERHKDDLGISQSLNELTENPLPATLNIKAFNLEDFPEISENLKRTEYKDFITAVNFDNEKNKIIIERLTRILKFIVSVGLGLIAVFSLIAVLVIFNTITLTIYNRKEEVEIMRLVGATNWYIRGPFLTESLMYSLFGTALAALLLIPIFLRLLPKVAAFVNPEVSLFNQNIFSYWYVVVFMLLISVVLSVISTFMAIRKYLKI